MEASKNPPPLMLSEWSAQLTTRSGLELNVRPAAPQDEQIVGDFFRQVTSDDLRFRFLSSLKAVGAGMVHQLVDVDHTATENLLAFESEGDGLVATAMIAADEQSSDAEVAISVRSDLKGQGVGWAMLQHACDYAKARGFKQLHTVELSDNRLAISLEQEMGFTGRPCPDDMNLTILTKQLEPA